MPAALGTLGVGCEELPGTSGLSCSPLPDLQAAESIKLQFAPCISSLALSPAPLAAPTPMAVGLLRASQLILSPRTSPFPGAGGGGLAPVASLETSSLWGIRVRSVRTGPGVHR